MRPIVALLLCGMAGWSQSYDRLAAADRLWNYVKYFHPRVTAPSVDWDAALVRATPKILASTNDADFIAALDEMLGVLHDPLTRVAQPDPGDPRIVPVVRTLDGITVVSMEPGDGSQSMQARNSLVNSLRGHGAIVFDLRSSRRPGMLPPALPLTRLSAGPGRAVRVHSGYAAEVAAGSGGYHSAWEIADGDGVGAAVIPTNALTPIFLVNRETLLPTIALAVQNAGTGAIVTEDGISELDWNLVRPVQVFGQVWVRVRIGERAWFDGTTGYSANVVLHKTGAEALAATIELAKSGKFPPAEARPRLDLPPARFNENSYLESPYPAAEVRMLAAARVWGVFHYFHPYAHLYGEDWNAALESFLPKMAAAANAREYHLAIAEMVTHTHDSHCFMSSPELSAFYGVAAPPLEIRPIEGQPVVTRVFEETSVHTGDVLVKIDGQPYSVRAGDLEKHIAASTPQHLQMRVFAQLLRGPAGPVRATFRDAQGQEYDVELARSINNNPKFSPFRTGEVFRLLTPKIGYVDLERLNGSQVDAMFDAFKDTDAIIMDMRGYPQGTAWSIAPRLTEKSQPVAAAFRRNVARAETQEGNEVSTLFFEQRIPATNQPRYHGKTVMLIDERAISQSEHSGLFYRTAGGTVFIGSGTAGANGDVTYFFAPGGIRINFSGHDVRWPDGKQLQRVGLIPDIEAHPSIAGIRAGKDEVLDRAVAYLQSGR